MIFEGERPPVEHQLLELTVGHPEHRATRCLVHTAGLHPHQPILNHVRSSHTVGAGQLVQPLDKSYGTEGHGVQRHRRSLLESYAHLLRGIGGFGRITSDEIQVVGWRGVGILEHTAFVGAVPQVTVHRKRLLGARLHGDVSFREVGEQLFAPAERPLAPRRDHLEVGGERLVGELEADLVVALAGAAVGERGRPRLTSGRHLPPCHNRARHGGTEQIRARVHGTGTHRGEDEFGEEPLPEILDHTLHGSRPHGLRFHVLEIALTLAHVGDVAQHPRPVGVNQPWDDG